MHPAHGPGLSRRNGVKIARILVPSKHLRSKLQEVVDSDIKDIVCLPYYLIFQQGGQDSCLLLPSTPGSDLLPKRREEGRD